MLKHMSIILLLILASASYPVFAQEITEGVNEMFISRTTAPFPTIDGKWTVESEWGRSTERVFIYDDEAKIAIRISHDRENIYVLLDMISDTTIDREKDKAVICFDTELNDGDMPAADDYCFMVVLDGSFTAYRGGGDTPGALSPIDNPSVEMKAGISDAFDRYSKVSHLAYELNVPIESLKRSDILGFYTAVYDASKKTTYGWPVVLSHGDDIEIKEPNEWGRMISPDKSIPEFPIGSIGLVAGVILFSIILMTRNKARLWGLGNS